MNSPLETGKISSNPKTTTRNGKHRREPKNIGTTQQNIIEQANPQPEPEAIRFKVFLVTSDKYSRYFPGNV